MTLNWISVLDQLPDTGINVLVACAALSDPVWIGYLDDDDGWRFVDGSRANDAVTHWMDLPEPPENKEKDVTP